MQGKKSGEGFKTAKSIPRDESNVNLSALFRRGVKPWRKMAAEGRGWVTSSPAFSLHVFAKEKTRIYFRSRILPTGGIKSFSSPFPYLFIPFHTLFSFSVILVRLFETNKIWNINLKSSTSSSSSPDSSTIGIFNNNFTFLLVLFLSSPAEFLFHSRCHSIRRNRIGGKQSKGG